MLERVRQGQVESTNGAVTRVKSVVEFALQNEFGKQPLSSDRWSVTLQGKLSTIPSRVAPDVESATFLNMCNSFSKELADCVTKLGLSVEQSNPDPHEFLLVPGEEVIVIDPSIGQFVDGHNHVFVGTIPELRNVVVDQTKSGLYILRQELKRDTPESFLKRMWGHSLDLTK